MMDSKKKKKRKGTPTPAHLNRVGVFFFLDARCLESLWCSCGWWIFNISPFFPDWIWIIWGVISVFLWMLGFLLHPPRTPREPDTLGNSRGSPADEKRHAPVAILRLSGSVFVPVTHCHHSHRAFSLIRHPSPSFCLEPCTGESFFDYIWVVTARQSKKYTEIQTLTSSEESSKLFFFPTARANKQTKTRV